MILRLLEEPEARPAAADVAKELQSMRAEISGGLSVFASTDSPGRGTRQESGKETADAPGPKSSDKRAGASKDNSESTASSFDDFSDQSIRKGLLSDALQHYLTIVPAFIAALALVFIPFHSSIALVILLVVLAISGAAATVSFIWHYFVRYNREYAKRMKEIMEAQDRERRERERQELVRMRDTLRAGFASIRSDDGLKALDRLANEHEQLQAVLSRASGSGLLSIAQVPALMEETYRQGLMILNGVLELLLAIHTSDKRGLETEVGVLEREIQELKGDESQAARIEIREGMLSTHRERLELLNEQELHAERFLFRSNQSEAALHSARIELASLRADSSETGVNAVTESLQKTIDQAKEVQEELRRLGY